MALSDGLFARVTSTSEHAFMAKNVRPECAWLVRASKKQGHRAPQQRQAPTCSFDKKKMRSCLALFEALVKNSALENKAK